ncbi:hypothetical protein ACN3XK_07330 [Actinomadura welshii]
MRRPPPHTELNPGPAVFATIAWNAAFVGSASPNAASPPQATAISAYPAGCDRTGCSRQPWCVAQDRWASGA